MKIAAVEGIKVDDDDNNTAGMGATRTSPAKSPLRNTSRLERSAPAKHGNPSGGGPGGVGSGAGDGGVGGMVEGGEHRRKRFGPNDYLQVKQWNEAATRTTSRAGVQMNFGGGEGEPETQKNKPAALDFKR